MADSTKWPCACHDGPIMQEPTVWHDNTVISKDGQLIDKEMSAIDGHHRCYKGGVCILVPVSCMPVFINGLASIFRVEMEERSDAWISHFLFKMVAHKPKEYWEPYLVYDIHKWVDKKSVTKSTTVFKSVNATHTVQCHILIMQHLCWQDLRHTIGLQEPEYHVDLLVWESWAQNVCNDVKCDSLHWSGLIWQSELVSATYHLGVPRIPLIGVMHSRHWMFLH